MAESSSRSPLWSVQLIVLFVVVVMQICTALLMAISCSKKKRKTPLQPATGKPSPMKNGLKTQTSKVRTETTQQTDTDSSMMEVDYEEIDDDKGFHVTLPPNRPTVGVASPMDLGKKTPAADTDQEYQAILFEGDPNPQKASAKPTNENNGYMSLGQLSAMKKDTNLNTTTCIRPPNLIDKPAKAAADDPNYCTLAAVQADQAFAAKMAQKKSAEGPIEDDPTNKPVVDKPESKEKPKPETKAASKEKEKEKVPVPEPVKEKSGPKLKPEAPVKKNSIEKVTQAKGKAADQTKEKSEPKEKPTAMDKGTNAIPKPTETKPIPKPTITTEDKTPALKPEEKKAVPVAAVISDENKSKGPKKKRRRRSRTKSRRRAAKVRSDPKKAPIPPPVAPKQTAAFPKKEDPKKVPIPPPVAPKQTSASLKKEEPKISVKDPKSATPLAHVAVESKEKEINQESKDKETEPKPPNVDEKKIKDSKEAVKSKKSIVAQLPAPSETRTASPPTKEPESPKKKAESVSEPVGASSQASPSKEAPQSGDDEDSTDGDGDNKDE